ncbi:MAG: hypothetical protein AAFZ02_03615 [Pseudomonadota bacterium]
MADPFFKELGRTCRRVAVGLIARAWPGETFTDVEARITAQSFGLQVVIVCSVLALLFLGALLAAQFGWIGMLVYFGAVILLVG